MNSRRQAPVAARIANPPPSRPNVDEHLRSYVPAIRGANLASATPVLTAPASRQFINAIRDGNGERCASSTYPDSYVLLPSVSFDDLHSSIESAVSSDVKMVQPPRYSKGANAMAIENYAGGELSARTAPGQDASHLVASNRTNAKKVGRSGSVHRRPSTSDRHTGALPMTTSNSGALGAASSMKPTRNRRQSHYPPISNSDLNSKPVRKSMSLAPLQDPNLLRAAEMQPRIAEPWDRPANRTSNRKSVEASFERSSQNSNKSRAIKAKSIQPSLHSGQAASSAINGVHPEGNRRSTSFLTSPRNGRGTTPLSGGKRASMMPSPHPSSHATGLGARTISPTDSRRLQRLSTLPQSQSLNFLADLPPPPSLAPGKRAESRSPSLIPRKASRTPSSSRTTPDAANRKPIPSGPALGLVANPGSRRSSMVSSQARLPPSSTSRLPAPNFIALEDSLPAEEGDDVPPVPAIPKAYESPKEVSVDAYSNAKKTAHSLTDAARGKNQPDNDGQPSFPSITHAAKMKHRAGNTKSLMLQASHFPNDSRAGAVKKHLQPLSLPPLKLGPLNLSLAPKMPAVPNGARSYQDGSPPLARQILKTPTTPMTAPKSYFFGRNRVEDPLELPSMRSSSSIRLVQSHAPSPPDFDSAAQSPDLEAPPKASISPFLSSSLPKSGFEQGLFRRSRPDVNENPSLVNATEQQKLKQRPAGPREPKQDKSYSKSPSPPEIPEDDPQTSGSKTSIKRKLSLNWRRGHAKSGPSTSGDCLEQSLLPELQPQEVHHGKRETVPASKLPASQTIQCLPNASLQADAQTGSTRNSGYLHSRRRKSSVASLNNPPTYEIPRGTSWYVKKDVSELATGQPHRSLLFAGRDSRSRLSSTAARVTELSALDLDKNDLAAEEEMRKISSKRKETEQAARTVDALTKRATAKERVTPHEAVRMAALNIFESGEIIDFDDIYFCGTQNARKVVGDVQSITPNFGYDDERGDYNVVPGDHLAYRYEVVDLLGKGSFGQVVRCIDHKLGALVAIKIIRNKKRFHQQALVEVDILQKLREWDPESRHGMVKFTQHFYFRGHLCISTELLDMNLYEFIKAHSFRGFSLQIIRRFTKQILSSLVLLKKRKVIHCDLKPENILLRHPLHSEIKVIDFGSSCFEHEKVYTYIQSRFYRSPEVILGMSYGMPIDMWSVGCILAELFTGVPIFPGENEQEQLACIMEVFGPPEKHLIEKSTRRKLFFDSMGKPRLTVSSKGKRRRSSSKTLQQVLKCEDDGFIDFLSRCLRWDPERRLKPEEATSHEFITGHKMLNAATSRLAVRETSPVKRNSTNSLPRPLPDPPGATHRAANGLRAGVSPHKHGTAGTAVSRRASGATAATAASINRRTSAMPGSLAGASSSLPRVTGSRLVSAKADLAAAGASAAMGRRG